MAVGRTVLSNLLRNPFGGAWRQSDGRHYEVENGPSIDRMARINAGQNYLWDGSDQSLRNFAIYNWEPSRAPLLLNRRLGPNIRTPTIRDWARPHKPTQGVQDPFLHTLSKPSRGDGFTGPALKGGLRPCDECTSYYSVY